MNIRVDTSALHAYSKRLKSLNRSAFPVAIRGTLNDAAYDVKLKSMPKSAQSKFKKRQPNFFKANSKVAPAVGFNVDTMGAEVGFYSNNLRGSNNRAVQDLEQQEHGGSIEKKTFIAEEGARTGNRPLGLVRPNRYLKKLPALSNRVAVTNGYGCFNGKLKKITSKKQMFIRAAFLAKKKYGGFVLGNKNNNGSRTLSFISSISSNKKGKVNIKRTPLYNVNKGRRVKVEATDFMKRASYETRLNINNFWIKRAQDQFMRHLKKK